VGNRGTSTEIQEDLEERDTEEGIKGDISKSGQGTGRSGAIEGIQVGYGEIQGRYKKIHGDTRRSGRDPEDPKEIHGYLG
jgi:hypothetical protein